MDVRGSGGRSGLDPGERMRLAALASAESLADLVRLTGTDSEHDAYFRAKREWTDLRSRELAGVPRGDGLPGNCVTIDGTEFRVHGITHADTPEERAYLREHVSAFLDGGATVYCEQGIRSMYFEDFPDARTMDDYRWATRECERLDVEATVADPTAFTGLAEDVDSLVARFREAAFSLIDSGGDVYGDEIQRAIGDVASYFLTSHEDLATGTDFESFRKTRQAATDPRKLGDLQRYYEKTFLPQPVEREWLRRHDQELELLTHARNERMADYAVYQSGDAQAESGDAQAIHLIVGAAHQPGISYYLRQHRDGHRDLTGFEPIP